MKKMRGGVSAGQRVRVRDEPWLVVDTECFERCTLVTLHGLGEGNLGESAQLLQPFDRVEPIASTTRITRVSRQAALRTAARAVLRARGWSDTWTATDARIDVLDWQLEPARAAVCGATRLLLADEVGLGKTIQAGLILAELRARRLISRALVLTPASLREQWAEELTERFALRPQIFDHASIARLTTELPLGVNPWATADLIVSSIDLVKRPEVRVAVDAVPLDAIVVDEAHHLTPGSDRGAVIADLASRVPWVVIVTATPHSGDERAYEFLTGLGQLTAAPDLKVFRRSAQEIGRERNRRETLCGITPTDSERDLLDEVLSYARALWTSRSALSEPVRLVATIIARRASSSATAVERTLSRRRALLAERASPADVQSVLPWDEGEVADAPEADAVLGCAGLTDRDREIAHLDRLVALARCAAADASKLRAVTRLLQRTREAVVLFTEYRDTVEDLRSRLADETTLSALHGGLSARERAEAVRAFLAGSARVLLATDAAGEGLNLQSRCRLVVNLELPWNPLRLEQRIGRVDRLGQTRRVHAWHLFHKGSIEDDVLARLQRRRQRASDCLLWDATSVEPFSAPAIADIVLGEVAPEDGPIQRVTSVPSSLSSSAQHVRTERRLQALLTKVGSETGRQSAVCAASTHAKPAAGMHVLFECGVHDRVGRPAGNELVFLRVSLDPPLPIARRIVRPMVAQLAVAVRASVESEIADRLCAVSVTTARAGTLIAGRLGAILGHIDDTRRSAPFQGSLFDRRAEQAARAREAVTAIWRDHLNRKVVAVQDLCQLQPASPPRLIAAWPIE